MDNDLELMNSLTLETKDQFITELSAVIQNWLEKRQLDKISYYLYRIDVNEFEANTIIQSTQTDEVKAKKLAHMMVDRHLKKLSQRP